MLVKENSSTKIIEDKMGFKFKDLEIIGKYKIGKIDVVFYRNSKKIFVFQIYDSSQITTIIRIPKLTSDNVKLQYRFEINGKVYNYDEDLMLFIKFCGETIFYTFYEHSNFDFYSTQKLEIADEEAVAINLLDSFFDDSKI